MAWAYEYTDTFGGEANYCWVKRGAIVEGPKAYSRREVVRRAKQAVGITGAKGKNYWHGDDYEFRPYRSCTVLFIRWADDV
jgi:hypothetical protein